MDEGLHKAHAMGASPVPPRRVIDDVGHVIGDHKAVETDCLERLYYLEGIDLAAVDEGLVEVLDRSDDVAEVDVDDFLLARRSGGRRG